MKSRQMITFDDVGYHKKFPAPAIRMDVFLFMSKPAAEGTSLQGSIYFLYP
jgi:hypothetical protein